MDLSNEDSLRLNVLLHQDIEAIRIDDSKMIVYGLSPRGEAQVPLNPNCRDEQYIKKVKEVAMLYDDDPVVNVRVRKQMVEVDAIFCRIETNAGHGAGMPTDKIIQGQADIWAFAWYSMGVDPFSPH